MIEGCRHVRGFLDGPGRARLAEAVRAVIAAAPLYTPVMPRSGRPFSVAMTNCGPLGWVSDRSGYRYQERHPETDAPWPAMPEAVLAAWRELSAYPHPPEACLVNWYRPGAKLGLHQDRDEDDLDAPVVSLSLGDTGLFRVGGTRRRDPTTRIELASGDALVLAGPARLAHHGVDRILAGTGDLAEGGRINLTLRRVTHPA